MRLGCIALLVTLASGCIPMSKTTTRTTARTLGSLVVDEPGQIELQVERAERTLSVLAQRRYRCRRDVVDHVEISTSMKAEMLGTTNGEAWGWWLLVPMGLLYPVGALDLVVANAVAVMTPDGTEREQSVAGTLSADCQVPARTRVFVALASGQEMESLTDEAGVAAFVLPPGEDARTVLVRGDRSAVHVATAAPVEVEIEDGVFITPNVPEPPATPTPVSRPAASPTARTSTDGFAGVSRAIRECGVKHRTKGTVTVMLAIEAGRITSVGLEHHDQTFVGCVRATVGTVTFEPTRNGTVRVPFKVDAR